MYFTQLISLQKYDKYCLLQNVKSENMVLTVSTHAVVTVLEILPVTNRLAIARGDVRLDT